MPSVAGVSWRAGETRGENGARTAHAVDFANDDLTLSIYSRYRLSPTLHWHLHLLGQLLGEFYVAKLREEKLRQASYLQAVHETGARTTHDIKNLLQSLNVLCSVAASDDGRDSAQLQSLVRRQLPVVAQRLSETLERLQRPQPRARPTSGAAPGGTGWRASTRAKASSSARRAARPARLPRSLFDSVSDNLIRNALAKRAGQPRSGCASRSSAASASHCASATPARRCPRRSRFADARPGRLARAGSASACTRPRARRNRAATGSRSRPTSTAKCASCWRGPAG